jgi:hypothetical protein
MSGSRRAVAHLFYIGIKEFIIFSLKNATISQAQFPSILAN